MLPLSSVWSSCNLVDLVNRSDMKPPLGRGYKKDNKKRAYGEDDELDPMDPSSYSDAPRGGWYVTCSISSSSTHFITLAFTLMGLIMIA